jgi:hypothetical protein
MLRRGHSYPQMIRFSGAASKETALLFVRASLNSIGSIGLPPL